MISNKFYILRPNETAPVTPLGDPNHVETYSGPLFDELHCYYNDGWISHVSGL